MEKRYLINLQFFAQEKTEKPTPRKKQEQRKKGNVAKSAEVPTALIMLGVFMILLAMGDWLGNIFQGIMKRSFTNYMLWDVSVNNTSQMFQEMSLEAAKAVGPIMLMAMVTGVFANYIQVGFLFATDPLGMKLERINPLKGFKRIFSARALVEFIKSIFKITLISVVVFTLLWSKHDEIILLSQKNVSHSLSYIGGLTVQIGIIVAIILIFLSILDFLYQKYEYEKNIRMSKQDIKDEHKKTEGDPLIKSKIRERQRQMAMRRMMQEVPKADVIITNPTHFAIAIQYEQEIMEAPIVIAKGTDYIALKIKEIAAEYEIVTMENKALARALYEQVDIGESVPEELFKAVAEVLAYVYRIKGKV